MKVRIASMGIGNRASALVQVAKYCENAKSDVVPRIIPLVKELLICIGAM